MRNLNIFATAVIACAATVPAMAVQVDDHIFEKDGVKIIYWNDFKNDISSADVNKLYPNWQVNTSDAQGLGEGTKGTVNYVYKKNGTDVLTTGAVDGTIGATNEYHNYLDLGVLENGTYTVEFTLTLIPEGETDPRIFVFEPYSFDYKQVEADPTAPAATMTWNVTNGATLCTVDYQIETENIEGATYRVWLEKPGPEIIDESNAQNGTLNVPIALGATVTYWLKADITLEDGTVIHPKNHDTGITFISESTEEIPVYTLTCTEAVALTGTTGTVKYSIGGPIAEADNVDIYVVTNAFGADKEVGRINGVTAAEGTISLEGLKENSINELWVKMNVTYHNQPLAEIMFPGAEQGYTGLSVTTTETSVATIESETAEAVYFNLQGQKVENPSAGLYIRVCGGKTSKVLVK